MDEYTQLVIYNLQEMREVFGLTQYDYTRAVTLAKKMGFQYGKPSSLALALIWILKPDLSAKTIYKNGRTSYPTMRFWILRVCRQLHIQQKIFKE